MSRQRKNHSPAFKAHVALEALRSEKTLAELAQQHDVDPDEITRWRNELMQRADELFGGPPPGSRADRAKLNDLQAKISELTAERDYLAGALRRVPGNSGDK
jgi:transposase-like protein